jgi:hypothetical protein
MKFLLRVVTAAAVILSLPLDSLAAPRVLNNCTTITDPGAYVVGRNITANGDCIVIATDFVNLDLDGFVLTGNGTGSGISQTLVSLGVGRRGIVVRNGVITNFLHGISLNLSIGARVENMSVAGNSFHGIWLGSMAAAIRNTVTNNGGTGIVLFQRGLAEGNVVSDNAGGISVDSGGNVTGNTVGHNQGGGIFVTEGAVVSNNVSRNNTGNGITADCPSLVIGNTSSNNLGDNLHVIGGACDPDTVTCCVKGVNNMTL